jgi:hypothetical protein
MKTPGLMLAAGVLSLWLGSGCASNKPGSSSQAYIQIKNQTTADIVTTTVAVYTAAGYTVAADQPGLLVFERVASRSDALKWGDWINDGMKMQIKVRFTTLSPGDMLLQADVYAVQDPNDAFFRNESKARMMDRRPYQKLLNEVRDRLEKAK